MEKEQMKPVEETSEPLQIYLNEIGQIPLLSEEEERILGERSARGGRGGQKEAFRRKSEAGCFSGKTVYGERHPSDGLDPGRKYGPDAGSGKI